MQFHQDGHLKELYRKYNQSYFQNQLPINGFDLLYFDQCFQCWNIVADEVFSSFRSNKKAGGNLWGLFVHKQIRGTYNYGIYINRNHDDMEETLIHEMTHFYNWLFLGSKETKDGSKEFRQNLKQKLLEKAVDEADYSDL